jgi:hypothetical protein
MTLDRTERQRLGVRKWIEAGCRGTLQWCTGVGINKNEVIRLKITLILKIKVCRIFYILCTIKILSLYNIIKT